MIVPTRIGNVTLPYVDCVTDLGVTYDNRLRFSSHINKIVTKASLRAKLTIRCFQSRDPSLLITAFCVLGQYLNIILLCDAPC